MAYALGAAEIHPGPLEGEDTFNGKHLNVNFQHLYPQALVYSWSEHIQTAPFLLQSLWHSGDWLSHFPRACNIHLK